MAWNGEERKGMVVFNYEYKDIKMAIGKQPKYGLMWGERRDDNSWVLKYDRELSEKEITQYKLVFLKKTDKRN